MKYKIQRTSQFKRDYKLAKKRGCDMQLLKDAIAILANGEQLPTKYFNHNLSGIYSGYQECHIEPDWLLVYKITESQLILTLYRTGTHSDLF
mgnify:CR=1 FL=1